VWEAGIGGRLDPVKLIGARHVALTALDLEHTALLGDTLETIAQEKVAAAPDGAKLFVASAAMQTEAVRAAVEHYCAAHAVDLTMVAPLASEAPLEGAFQRSNAALALRLAAGLTPLNETQIAAGFASTRWPGRLERLSDEPLVIIDVGHTPDGVASALKAFLAMRGERTAVLVCGVSQDKDANAIVAQLAPAFSSIICAAASHKGAPAALIAAYAQNANPSAEIALADSVADARRLALAKARGGAVYVAGGLFLAAEFKAVHLGRDPASLAFF
jgi:dihydrofolate synthase/folylpolyglutamate synthase